jgi:hypothetical protein
MTIILAALVAVLGVPWGAFWAFIRDQGQPRYIPEAEKDRLKAAGEYGFDDWREIGMGVFGLPLAILAGLVFWTDWMHGVGWGVGIYALITLFWSQGHKEALDLSDRRDWIVAALMGAGVTLGPAIALGWHGHYVLAPIVLAAGAAKCLTYWLGYRLRRGTHNWPHATSIGHVLHGALAYGVTAACMVLA